MASVYARFRSVGVDPLKTQNSTFASRTPKRNAAGASRSTRHKRWRNSKTLLTLAAHP
jgi:hypothetical protein